MSVVIETTLGDITVDLYLKHRPRACFNFLKLCKIKYYNYNLFHTVGHNFIAQTGDPTGTRRGGESIHGYLDGPLKRYFEAECQPKIKHTVAGLISFVGSSEGADQAKMVGSQFFFTLAPDLNYLDDQHCVFGEVVEGLDVIELLNESICDGDKRPYQDIRVTHTVVLDDPFPDPDRFRIPARSPSPSAERLQGGRIAPDEEIDDVAGKDIVEIEEVKADREAKARATILEMVGDIPDAEMAPPENVLFVCKLNPVTTDDDLEIIFSRFGEIKSCEVIRDRKSGDSLQYAFIEFAGQKSCEDAYFKMDNVLIDDRRIHVDFSQSVAKIKWLGKGRGVKHYGNPDEFKGGKGQYVKQEKEGNGKYKNWSPERTRRDQPNSKRNVIQDQGNRRNRDKTESRRHESIRSRSRDRANHRESRRYESKRRSRSRSRTDNRSRDKTNRNNEWRRSRSKDRTRYRAREDERHRDEYKSYNTTSKQDRQDDYDIKNKSRQDYDSKLSLKKKRKESDDESSASPPKETERKKRKSKKKKKRRSSSSSSSSSSEDKKSKKKRRDSSSSSDDDKRSKKKKGKKKNKKRKYNDDSSS